MRMSFGRLVSTVWERNHSPFMRAHRSFEMLEEVLRDIKEALEEGPDADLAGALGGLSVSSVDEMEF